MSRRRVCPPMIPICPTIPSSDRMTEPKINRKDKLGHTLGQEPQHRAIIVQKQILIRSSGGEGGIRTPDTVARMPHFECGAFNHSATSPQTQGWSKGGEICSMIRQNASA